MRQPTPTADLYAWHREALAGMDPPNDGTPHCGWFKRKLVKGGVMVPARVWAFQDVDPATGELLSDELLQCEVAGRKADPEEAWSWICQNPITEAEFRYLEAAGNWAREHAPDEPMADPLRPIDWLKVPTPSF